MTVLRKDQEKRTHRRGRHCHGGTMTRRLLLASLGYWFWPALVSAEEAPRARENQNQPDAAVLKIVLKDLIYAPGSPLNRGDKGVRRIFFAAEPYAGAPLQDRVIRREDPHAGWGRLSPEQLEMAWDAGRDLARRGTAKDGFAGIKLYDRQIVVYSKEQGEKDAKDPRKRDQSLQVFQAYPPGYSLDQRLAVVHLRFPWFCVHEGDATYVLALRGKQWIILVRQYTVYP